MRISICAAFAAGALLCAGQLRAQAGTTIVNGGIGARLYSAVLEEERTVWVALPGDYEQTSQRFPVLYVLDGEAQFQHAAAAVEFLAAEGRIPRMIVVAIPNTFRLRDLSPPTDVAQDIADGAGGDAFVDFLTRELFPWVEASYRAAPLRILFGHSRGGLINLHALLTRPDAFRAHIAASPYFGWSRERMIGRAAAELPRVPGRHYLYMSAGDQEPQIRTSVIKLTEVLERLAVPGLQWHFEPLVGESHGSTPYLTLYRGLKGFFASWYPAERVAAGDVDGVLAHYAALSRDYGYDIVPGVIAMDETGHALLEKGKVSAALRAFERNVAAYPRNRYVYESLSAGLEAAGRRTEALRAIETAQRIASSTADPEDRMFLRRRAQELRDTAR